MLRKIDLEDKVWILWLILIGLSFYANNLERKYYAENDLIAREKYRFLNIFIFSVALMVYWYFFSDGYKGLKKLTSCDSPRKVFFNEINHIAGSLALIAGSIMLFIAIFDKELETEIFLT